MSSPFVNRMGSPRQMPMPTTEAQMAPLAERNNQSRHYHRIALSQHRLTLRQCDIARGDETRHNRDAFAHQVKTSITTNVDR